MRRRGALANRLRAFPAHLARSFLQDVRQDRARWALWLPVAFGTGVGVYFGLPVEPPLWLALLGSAVAIAAAMPGAKLWFRRPLVIGVAAFGLGFCVAKCREAAIAAPVIVQRLEPVMFEGRVVHTEPHGKGIRVIFDDVSIAGLRQTLTPARIRVSFRVGAESLVPGEHAAAMAVLMPPPGPAAPGGYDFARTAFFEGIGGVGYAYGAPARIGPKPIPSLAERAATQLNRLRWRMTLRIHRALPGSEGAIASALITGERGGISERDEQALRDAGLAHVLAIAGLHMALVGLGLFWLVRWLLALVPHLALNYPIKKWSACVALLAAAFYLIVSGAGAPTIRAFTMLAMMLLAILADRPALSMRAVALAATIILAVEPESLTAPGFQMSFAAVVSLVAVAEWEQARRARNLGVDPVRFGALRRYIRGIATTSLVGSLATLPYAVYHFDRATHYAVLGNLLAMPIMGFIVMPSAALAVMAMPFGLELWPLKAMGLGVDAMLFVGRWVSGLPGATSVVPAWPIHALVLVSLGGLWCALWRSRWRWAGLLPAAIGVAVGFAHPAPDILVARDLFTVAFRAQDGRLELLPDYRDGYSANEWLKRDGDQRTATEAVAGRDDGVGCDGVGCIAHLADGTKLAVPTRADAFGEDCAWADILVGSPPEGMHCDGPKLIIAKSDIARAGGYAIRLEPFAVETVDDARGRRPWTEGVAQ